MHLIFTFDPVKKSLIIILLILGTIRYGYCQDAKIAVIADSVFKNSVIWDDHKVMPVMRDSLFKVYKSHPQDDNIIILLRYYLYVNYNLEPITDSLIHASDSLVNFQFNIATGKPQEFTNHLAACYNYLGMMSQAKNNFARSKRYYENGLDVVNGFLSRNNGSISQSLYVSLLNKKSALLNNIGNLVYQATNHKDPVEKRNEIGPMIERYWLESDSIESIVSKIRLAESTEAYCNFSPIGTAAQNLILLYGYYYPNQSKVRYYYEAIQRKSKLCDNEKMMDRVNISLGWVTFCREEFQECLPYFTNYLKKYPEENSSFVQDARYGLCESYYNLKMPDSVIYYGLSYFQDTVYFKDYLFLSMSSVYMTEMFMEKGDVAKAKVLLKLSKEFMAKSQHEASIREYKKEGEEIMLNTAVQKLAELSSDIENRDDNIYTLQLIILFAALLGAIGCAVYFIRRLQLSKNP